MKSLTLLKTTGARRPRPAILGTCVLLFSGAITSFAQAPMPAMPQNATADAAGQGSQADQIAELRAQIAKLQAESQRTGPGRKSTAKPGMKMGTGKAMNMPMMDDKGEMGAMPPKMPAAAGAMAMEDDEGEMGGMSGGAQSSAPAPAMGMCCMGEMGGMSGGGRAGMSGGAAQPAGGMAGMRGSSSAMPGQPGASHLYHIGSTGFFLNHSRHITLTQDQRMTLNRLKEKAMLDRASSQWRIDQAEQELYALTGADQPDTSNIQAKVAEIEKRRADQRMNFIRAVGEASKVLTYEQQQALIGTMAANRK